MTISSHPQLKFLVAVVAGIAVGIWLDSWGWGIGTFFGLMFIFIWVASWIFGSPFDKSKVPVTDELEALLDKLSEVGRIKNALPMDARGWCSRLGLYVQLKDFGDRSRLQAGDKRHAFIDAWQEYFSEWKVRKYSPGSWEKLVDPTLRLSKSVQAEGRLNREYIESVKAAIDGFNRTGYLRLPSDKQSTRSCTLCRYGPNLLVCQMGKTGKTRSDVDIAMNPFGPQPPIHYFVTQPNDMPCFEPKDD